MNALFLCCNADYAEYAKGAIVSFRRHYPDWKIHIHMVNCKYLLARDRFWQQPFIVVDALDKAFDDKGLEREYCNSRRFCAFTRWLNLYDKMIATDCDILFKERLDEIETALDTNDVCMYYNPTADPRNQAGASFLAFRSGSGANQFLSTYKKYLNAAGRNWWNDQICLARAREEMAGTVSFFDFPYEAYCYSGLDAEGLKGCHVIQPRGDKNSPVLQYYRNMLEAELRGACDRIMIIGSGISSEKVKSWDLSGWHVIAINNAWQATDDWDELIYPNDFNKLPPSLKPNQKLVTNETYMRANTAFGTQDVRGNTMIFQALYYALLKKPKVIGTIGCDLHYPTTGKTHFYGNGGLDPMRLGRDTLIEKFDRFIANAKELKVELYNFSGEGRGLNPFPQKMFQSTTIARRWPKHFMQPKRLHLGRPRPRLVVLPRKAVV
jgi:hypothetical protein